MNLLLEPLFCLLMLGLLLIFAMALTAPFETFRWWSGWAVENADNDEIELADPQPPSAASHFIVYLTAIGGISATDISGREKQFLERLQAKTPQAVIISDVFPFSVTNNPLNGERLMGWLWQKIHNSRLHGRAGIFAFLIFVRNLLQVGVSSDPRYGPLYNVGVAHEIVGSLLQHGYTIDSSTPISVMGWSGGGQIAVGVARYLHRSLGAPLNVISIGGVFADDPGFAEINHLLHLQGSKDSFPKVGQILYPGRWSFVRYSVYNQAVRDGRVTFINPGPMHHTGRNDYFDHKATLPDGQTFLDKTVEIIATTITENASSSLFEQETRSPAPKLFEGNRH
ncbi:MAG: hypothetical protein GY796_11515 [Chloroflexi bacterium]|nr:hypothetical protein [Chloroflexota bacterium]